MNQDAIWEHFQNEGVDSFSLADPRLHYLLRQLRPGTRVLNIGVGSAMLEKLGSDKGVEMWSLDPSARTIERIRQSLNMGERAQVGYSQDMPWPAEHFDALVMSEVLEHLEPEIFEATLREVHRVLKPGGRFIGTVPARERLENSAVVCPKCSHHFHRWGHCATFDVPTMRRLLQGSFQIETVREQFFNEWDSVGLGRRAAGLVKKFLSWRGIGTYGVERNIFFIARKQV